MNSLKEYCKTIHSWLFDEEGQPSEEYIAVMEVHPDGAKEVVAQEDAE